MSAQIEEIKSELEDTLDAYLNTVVEQFVEDNIFAMDESIKKEKYEAVLEGFNSLMVTTGVEIAQIAEAKEKIEEEQNESSTALADKLMAENIELKERNAELLKTGLIKESAEDMTSMQRDKFFKLAKLVEFDASAPVDFIEKMDTIAESIKGEKATTKVIEEKTEEKVEEKLITEKVDTEKYVSKASHLF
jgi:hypothetical protein